MFEEERALKRALHESGFFDAAEDVRFLLDQGNVPLILERQMYYSETGKIHPEDLAKMEK